MKIEKWQDVDDWLVCGDKKAVIVQNQDELKDEVALKKRLETKGQPINSMRQKLVKLTVKKKVRADPLSLKSWFNRHQDSHNAKKVEKLASDKPTHQYKQIKNEIAFFGESFLEGFLGFYGLEVDNALARYEKNLHVLEEQELGHDAPRYYIAKTDDTGNLIKASDELPTKKIAEEEIQKFYRQPEEQQEQSEQKLNRDDKDEN